jgi:transcriptional regulator with XRE-family HTH domain
MAKSWFDRKHTTPRQQLLFEQERAVLLATEEVLRLMGQEKITKATLARRLGKSKAYVTQALSGGRNMTLRTLAEFAWACGASVGGFQFVRGARAERAARAAPRATRRNGRAPRAAA